MIKKIKEFFRSRYGIDHLSIFLITISLILMILFSISKLRIFIIVSNILLLWSLIRSFSSNSEQRIKENYFFLNKTKPIRIWFNGLKTKFKQRKTHRFFRCPNCNKDVRVPKNKGKIIITCPNCNMKFERRS